MTSSTTGHTAGPWEDAAESICGIVEARIKTTIKSATDRLYDDVMSTTQEYLRDNVDFNLKSELDSARSSAFEARKKADALAGQVRKLQSVLQHYVNAYPAFRIKPVGEPGSPKRIEQENLMALEDSAHEAIAKATGAS